MWMRHDKCVSDPSRARFTANWACQVVVMNSEQTIVALRSGNSRESPFWPQGSPSGCDQSPVGAVLVAGN